MEKFGVAGPHRPDKVGRNDQMCQEAPSLWRTAQPIKIATWKRARRQKTETHALRKRGGFFSLGPKPRTPVPRRTRSAQSPMSSRIFAITIDRSSTREPMLSFVKIFLRCVLTVAALMNNSFANACVLFPIANFSTI